MESNMIKKKIFIDPGHGGSDPGAVGNGMRESDINLDVSLRLNALLQRNFDVKLSREADVSPLRRWQLANNWGADLFLSIHVNAFTSPSANGTETMVFDNGSWRTVQSRNFATVLQRSFITTLGTRDRGVRPDTESQHTSGLSVLRNTNMPAVLFELAFITAGPQFPDTNVLRNRRSEMAHAISVAVHKYFNVIMEEDDMRFQTVEEMPLWAQAEIRELIDAGYLSGTGHGLNLTEDMIRTIILNKRQIDTLRKNLLA